MTYIFSASLTPTTSGEAMFNFKSLLVSAGWTVVSSSNGSTLSAGDIITSGTVLDNSNAYFIIKQPLGATGSYGGVQREFGFQRGAFSGQWKVQYMQSSASVNGGTATTMPSGSDKAWYLGSNSSFVTIFTTNNTYRWSVCADNAAPYGFWAGAFPTGGGNPTTLMIFDPMVSGSFVAADNDPFCFYAANSNAGLLNANGSVNALNQFSSASFTESPRTWFKKGLSGESFEGVGAGTYIWYNSSIIRDATVVGTNTITTFSDLLPLIWASPASKGYKGISSLMRINTSAKTTGDTISVASAGSKEYIVFKDIVLPWNGTNPII